jgi:hypothetical protein
VEGKFLADICAMVFDGAVMNEQFVANGLARLASATIRRIRRSVGVSVSRPGWRSIKPAMRRW